MKSKVLLFVLLFVFPSRPTDAESLQNQLGCKPSSYYSNFINEAADLHLLSSQESRESNTGAVTSAGHYLHALLRESRRR